MDHSAIINARRHFESVLEDVIGRANEPSGGQGKSSGTAGQATGGHLTLPGGSRTSESAQAGRRGTGKSPRKRPKVRDDSKGQSEELNHVMKLFDRSVDLAQFDMDTPLYVICRAWMKNLQPTAPDPRHDTAGLDLLSYASREEMQEAPILYLPGPTEESDCDESSKTSSRHLPTDLATAKANVDAILQHAESDVEPEQVGYSENLLSHNLQRWQALREGRRRQAQQESVRYAESFRILSQELKKPEES